MLARLVASRIDVVPVASRKAASLDWCGLTENFGTAK